MFRGLDGIAKTWNETLGTVINFFFFSFSGL